MFEAVLPKYLPKHLEKLRVTGILKSFYLAGGTAAALHMGHRISADLDFFSKETFKPRRIAQELSNLGHFRIDEMSPGTLHGTFESIRLTFLHYPYPLLSKTEKYLGLQIAGIMDIACMKTDAMSSRGSRKDFIDLYFICQKAYSLSDILNSFERKYRKVSFNRVHIVKSFCYFKDAEVEPMPKMLVPFNWHESKKFFQDESKKIAKSWL